MLGSRHHVYFTEPHFFSGDDKYAAWPYILFKVRTIGLGRMSRRMRVVGLSCGGFLSHVTISPQSFWQDQRVRMPPSVTWTLQTSRIHHHRINTCIVEPPSHNALDRQSQRWSRQGPLVHLSRHCKRLGRYCTFIRQSKSRFLTSMGPMLTAQA